VRSSSKHTGLTVLEVVIAAFIFSGLITVLSSLWVMHARVQRQTGMMLVAADLADLQMSRAMSQGYHAVTPSSGTFEQTWTVRGDSVKHVFTSTVEVVELVDEDANPLNMKAVTVVVTYGEGTDQPRSYRLESVLTDDTE
jgi:Tfp pilus assembly protein PilV